MIDIAIPLFLVACGIAVILMKDLLSSIMVFTVYSLVMAIEWARLNAVDVAITEAAVGAGITTVLFMAVLSKTRSEEDSRRKNNWPALIVTLAVSALLVYGTFDMPRLMDPANAPNVHVAPYYLENTYKETGVYNVVTAILASYRGYDTLGEVVVVSTAGLCTILLLRRNYSGVSSQESE
jgi:multicomponent Na+:H+ antiporter subunit B